MSDTEIGLLICGFYAVLFLVGNIIREARRKHNPRRYIQDGKLVVGELMKAGGTGLLIPVGLTLAGMLLTSGPCEDERQTCASFGELVFDCQLMVAALLSVAVIYWIAKLAWRFVIRPVGGAAIDGWRWLRPKIPVQW